MTAGSTTDRSHTTAPTIAEVAGKATRFTDYNLPDAGIRPLFTTDSVWQAWLDVEAALARAQAKVGLVPAEQAAIIEEAAQLSRIDTRRVRRTLAEQEHPLMPLISELARVAGDPAGGYVHWGATSQNIMQTGHALLLRRAHAIVSGLHREVIACVADLAEDNAEVLMAGRTHGQHAVPITFGFKAAGWLDELVRAHRRTEAAVRPCLTVMMGGAVGTFAALGEPGPQIQELIAEDLGLDAMPVPSRALLDPFAGYATALAIASAAGARICADIATLMQTEFGELSEPVPDASVGSSTMPHKRNPKLTYDVIQLSAEIRALTPAALEMLVRPSEADGAATALMTDILERSLIATGDLLVRLRHILTGLEIFPDRMRDNLRLTGGLISSEAVMIKLAEFVGRDHAHTIVHDDATKAVLVGGDFLDVLGHDPRVTGHLDPARLRRLLAPTAHTGLASAIARDTAHRARDYLAGVDY
ncbi:MAG: adenylosuccinate lyase family protein [Hamadaea sp.]|uniref:class-II fumarase/aspartase family protein n=1 Tax=Hamadaea sp. TaxID=2024425 RepID=UPI0017E082D3|nr:adenylosuccinate lyase family protein [Hamadaea sp.]NUT18770.1 adenylosuccinate lyase family protein [Hamadaea sp.]